jgi:hypothetical protein
MIPTIMGARTFTRNIRMAIIIMTAIIATMIEPALPDVLMKV